LILKTQLKSNGTLPPPPMFNIVFMFNHTLTLPSPETPAVLVVWMLNLWLIAPLLPHSRSAIFIIRDIMNSILTQKESKVDLTVEDECIGLPLLPRLRDDLFEYFLQRYTELILQVGHFDICVPFVNLFASFCAPRQGFAASNKASRSDLQEGQSQLAARFLKQKWKQGKLKLDSVGYLLEIHIRLDPRPLKVIEQLCSLISAISSDDTNESEYGTLSKKTMPYYYVTSLVDLVTLFSTSDFTGDATTNVKKILKISTLFTDLMQITKQQDVHYTILACALKQGKIFVELFIKNALPLLHKIFKDKQNECLSIFKTVQRGTRIIQTLCAHGKLESAKNGKNLLTIIPNVKKVMELLIFSVKQMLESLDFQEAFSVGNLKHKDIVGSVLSSQDPVYDKVLNKKAKKETTPKIKEKQRIIR